MAIGYACLTVGIPKVTFKTCRLKNATPEKLNTLIEHNLKALDQIIDYNIANNIKLFRISSDIIPFGSHPVNENKWWDDFKDDLTAIGQKAMEANMRLSMHPGQYTVLNSPSASVVERAKAYLAYHNLFLDSLGLEASHNLILHIGGVYGNKETAMEHFKDNFQQLDPNIKKRLVIENDDKAYTIEEVLSIGSQMKIPVVYDNLHNQVNPADSSSDAYLIQMCQSTWTKEDGPQKVHYSQQAMNKKPGSHSATIDLDLFMDFYHHLPHSEIDIMLEVKDKNLSAMKAIHATNAIAIKYLETAWSRYKYWVLERSPQDYQLIRTLLKDKTHVPTLDFYRLIDHALAQPLEDGNALNAAQHVWGYFKKQATPKELERYNILTERWTTEKNIKAMKRFLWNLTVKYRERYLLESLYFREFNE
ncbi:UV DNA damage repair endonuclease UvsE [Aerococcaceae bacterium DSM 111020]|nr:UV DNA damage repair endonuclease UvsE [Aerococcaceae bacterium DSM 111020]